MSVGPDGVDGGAVRLRLNAAEASVLQLLRGHDEPKGARIVMRELRPFGIDLSQASVSRLLVRLDDLGLTVSVGGKGRVLTPAGRSMAGMLLKQETRTTGLSVALDVTHIEQLLDLLRARRGLEREIVLVAAERATPDDLVELERAWRDHAEMVKESNYRGRVANEFHKVLVRSAHSALFETLSAAILYDALDALDPLLFLITSWNGTVREAPDEHHLIVDALRARDAETAQVILDGHLSRLITEVEELRDKDRDGLFANFLSFTTTRSDSGAYGPLPRVQWLFTIE